MSLLSRPSGVHTPQNVSDHQRVAPRLLSMSSVPSTMSCDFAPAPMNSRVRFDSSASTNSLLVIIPL